MNSPDTAARRAPGHRRVVARVVRWPVPSPVEPTPSGLSTRPQPEPLAVLCWLVVVLAGYYLVGLGVTLPSMVATGALGLTAAGATAVATCSLVGMAGGAALLGGWRRRLGLRNALLVALAASSLSQLLVPLAPGVTSFAVLRLVGGVGVGLGLPALISLVAPGRAAVAGEARPHRVRAGLWLAAGYHLGAVLAAALGLWLLPRWSLLHLTGGVVGLVLLVPLLRALPGSGPTLAPATPAPPPDRTPAIRVLASWRHRWVGVATVLASFTALLLVHGLNTWLPTLLDLSGYRADHALLLLLVLNVGALVGLACSGRVAARLGNRSAVLLWFAVAALGLVVLSIPTVPTVVLFAVVLLTGGVVASTQTLIHGYVATVVPADTERAASGLVIGLGRVGAVVGTLVTGLLVAAGMGDPWAFQLFAGTALLGLLVLVVMTPRTIDLDVPPTIIPDPRIHGREDREG